MAWYYEILGKDDEVLETSEPIYENADEAEMAGYRRVKERPDYFYGPITTDWRKSGGRITQRGSVRPHNHGQAGRRGNLMRRLSIACGMIFTFPLISVFASAQSSPEIGVWKLNLAKSKFYNSQPPKNETRIVEPDSDGVKVHMEGVAGDGGPIDFTYSYKYSDGKDSSTGNVVVKRVNAHTFLGTTKRDGKVVGKTRAVISDDGRVMKFFYSGIDEDGKRTGHRTVYDKQ